MQRRDFIRLAAGGIVAAAGTVAVTGCSFAEVPSAAVASWQEPAGDKDLRRSVLSYALLAPNPHNLQPWLADLGREGEITLRLDTQRLLPATDPMGRQIVMGAGAFLELLAMAAAERGHSAECELFPEGEPGVGLDAKPFARVRLVADAGVALDPLFAHVLTRRTDRRAYDAARPLVAADADKLRAAIGELPVRFGLAGDETRVALLRAITREAWRIELTTPAPMMESMRLLRIGSREIDQHRDGITITSPFRVVMARTGLFDRNQFPAPDSQATQGQIKDFDAITTSTPAYLWLVTEGNRRTQQVDAGRAYARVNLAGTAVGLAMHPNQQALQEYPEMARQYQAIHALLDAPSPRYTVQMLARVGHLPVGMAPAAPAPRRGLAAQLTT
jgi:hypothetical protein